MGSNASKSSTETAALTQKNDSDKDISSNSDPRSPTPEITRTPLQVRVYYGLQLNSCTYFEVQGKANIFRKLMFIYHLVNNLLNIFMKIFKNKGSTNISTILVILFPC